MSRPPYLAWVITIMVALLTLWIELRPAGLVDHPFVTQPIEIGDPIDGSVSWRTIPEGVLEPVPVEGFATRRLLPADPLLPGDVTESPSTAPSGWWTIELELPVTARVGDAIQLVVLPEVGLTTPSPIGGVVVRVGQTGSFGTVEPGAAAFAPEDATAAAVAIAEDRASVLVATRSTWDFANSS